MQALKSFLTFIKITPYNLIHGPEAWLGIAVIGLAILLILCIWAFFDDRGN